ncbi:MAG: S8 family peptidase, partial [Acidimicrobiales bacterium]
MLDRELVEDGRDGLKGRDSAELGSWLRCVPSGRASTRVGSAGWRQCRARRWLAVVAVLLVVGSGCTAGGGGDSAEGDDAPPAVPGVPAGVEVVAQPEPGTVRVAWEAVQGADGHRVAVDGPPREVTAGICESGRCAVSVPVGGDDAVEVSVAAVGPGGVSPASRPIRVEVNPAALAPPLSEVYAVVAAPSGALSVERFPVASDAEAEQLVAGLRTRPDVVDAGRDHPAGIDSTGRRDDGDESAVWHLDALDLDRFPAAADGRDVTVAVIDGGVDATHPGLRGRVDDGISVADPGDSGIALPFWHATAIAGLIVGQGPGNLDVGAAPGARVLPIDVIGTDRRLSFGRTVAGVITAVDAGADVITMSLGN